MLSILIPTYNYNAFPLVEVLQKQAQALGIVYEIIVVDDASTDFKTTEQNELISTLENCYYHYNTTNLGRGENRNFLSRKARYDWTLLLDSDTLPVHSDFLQIYIDCIQKNQQQAFFGGLAYEENLPKKEALLRWVYGRQREALPVSKRINKPYESTLVSNLLIRKELLLSNPFHSEIYDYGFEDFVFIAGLKKNQVEIAQVNNPVYHLNLENSTVFLSKHLLALSNLDQLIARNIIPGDGTRIGKTRKILRQSRLDALIVTTFHILEKSLKANLLSDHPSLRAFDFYKLGYFCALKST